MIFLFLEAEYLKSSALYIESNLAVSQVIWRFVPVDSFYFINCVARTDISHPFFGTILLLANIGPETFRVYVDLPHFLLLVVTELLFGHHRSPFDRVTRNHKVVRVVAIGKEEFC